MDKKLNARSRWLLISFIALILFIAISLSVSQCSETVVERAPITEEEYLTLADELEANVGEGKNKKHYYVSSYLEEWGFPAFEV